MTPGVTSARGSDTRLEGYPQRDEYAGMTLVIDRDIGRAPALHALVIGVGDYPWLEDGPRARNRDLTDGMGQLDSPPLSAMAFCDWLGTEYADAQRRVATVELLLSAPGGGRYTPLRPDGGRDASIDVEGADFASIRAAARRWKERGQASEEDMLMFFFCGHGMSSGFEYALLASDYAQEPDSPFDGSFSLPRLAEHMRYCKASQQVFFVDACRVATDRLLLRYADGLSPLVGMMLPLNVGVQQSIFYSALPGTAAYGRIDDKSLFTEALLESLRGVGASDNKGYWSVETTTLHGALATLLGPLADPNDGDLQTPQTGWQSVFEIARIERTPKVPLFMKLGWHEGADPPDEIATVTVSDGNVEIVTWQAPWPLHALCSWTSNRFRSDLPAGTSYSCVVRFEDGRAYTSPPKVLMPPFRLVEIPEKW